MVISVFLFSGACLFATAPRYLVRGTLEEGTVLDSATKLVWQQSHSHEGPMDWKSALAHCETLEYGSQTDWRLPDVRELMTVVDEKRVESPSVNTVFFKDFFGAGYWTSTTHRKNFSSAYVIYFNEQNTVIGRGGMDGLPKTSSAYVLCVTESEK